MTETLTEDRILVACGCDDNYGMPLAVTLFSLIDHLPKGAKITIFLLSLGIEAETAERIRKVMLGPGVDVELCVIHVHEDRLQSLSLCGHLSPATYLRFFLPELLPTNCDRVIYLDSDLVVLDDITPLWSKPIGDNLLLAAADEHEKKVSGTLGLANWRELGIPEDAEYFNAGVLVINLNLWRETGLAARLIAYAAEHNEILKYSDQDCFVAICYDSRGSLEQKWNRFSTQMKAVQKSERPAIVHFVTSQKPWTPGYRVNGRGYWFDALKRSGWFSSIGYLRWRLLWLFRHYGTAIRRELFRR
jgi:lipopolysaccharide biosynthesis glycosyltransferase